MVQLCVTGGQLGNNLINRPSLHNYSIRQPYHVHCRQFRAHAGKDADDEEPNWETEMSIFKKRTLKPSQMEALRKLEEDKVDVGRVRKSLENYRPVS